VKDHKDFPALHRLAVGVRLADIDPIVVLVAATDGNGVLRTLPLHLIRESLAHLLSDFHHPSVASRKCIPARKTVRTLSDLHRDCVDLDSIANAIGEFGDHYHFVHNNKPESRY
jgi:hypothetical protein